MITKLLQPPYTVKRVLSALSFVGCIGALSFMAFKPVLAQYRLLPRITLELGEKTPFCLAYSPDGKYVAVGTERITVLDETPLPPGPQGEAMLWDAHTGKPLRRLHASNIGIPAIAFSPNGKQLAICDENQVAIQDVQTGAFRHSLGLGGFRPISIAFSPDGETLAIGYEQNRVELWDPTRGAQLSILTTREAKQRDLTADSRVASVAFSSDGTRLAAVVAAITASPAPEAKGFRANSSVLNVWNLRTPNYCQSIPLDFKGGSVAFTPNSNLVVVAGDQSSTYVYDPQSNAYQVNVLAFDARTGQEKWRKGNTYESGPTSPRVDSVAVSPNGRWVATSVRDIAHLRTANQGEYVTTFISSGEHDETYPHSTTGVVFSPDSKTLAVRGKNTIDLWDITGLPQ
jgi:WD40 repeat protein